MYRKLFPRRLLNVSTRRVRAKHHNIVSYNTHGRVNILLLFPTEIYTRKTSFEIRRAEQCEFHRGISCATTNVRSTPFPRRIKGTSFAIHVRTHSDLGDRFPLQGALYYYAPGFRAGERCTWKNRPPP